jgi:hypothetical protein
MNEHQLQQQGMTRLEIVNGLLYLGSSPLDTTKMVTMYRVLGTAFMS